MMQEKRIEEQLIVCGKSYRILRLLGHGKGGYSYLAESEGQPAVIKQIHHEPCDYYAFGNKIEVSKGIMNACGRRASASRGCWPSIWTRSAL